MSDFETEATLELAVREQDLRRVRQQIQEGIGETEIPPETSAGRPGERMSTDGGMSGRQRRRECRSFRWERERTDDVEDLLDVARSIAPRGRRRGVSPIG